MDGGSQGAMSARPIPWVLEQHAQDAAVLFNSCTMLRRAPHVRLRHLSRFENRLAAHLDGLAVGREAGLEACDRALELPGQGAVFGSAVLAIEDQRLERLERLTTLVMAVPAARRGLYGAFGWVEPTHLSGIVAAMLTSPDSFRRLLAVAACGMHRVDPGLTTARRLEDPEPMVRARAWRAAGELGMQDLRPVAATAAAAEDDPDCQCWAAWSAILLGAKGRALDLLKQVAMTPGRFRRHALQLTLQAMSVADAHALLRPLAQDVTNTRLLIRGAGLVGDPAYVPWLIDFMADDGRARLAGESFSLVTGLDLAWLDLERKPPENFESGPNDDPNDPNVEMDEDDGLPWPDPAKIQSWWDANSHRFQPGVRYFMGEPLNPANCLRVLKEGFQRQRILAAHYLCLLNPGTVLFNASAPAWRQQRLLSLMS
jgi:uncharacterized protein (TIGR02270 family)